LGDPILASSASVHLKPLLSRRYPARLSVAQDHGLRSVFVQATAGAEMRQAVPHFLGYEWLKVSQVAPEAVGQCCCVLRRELRPARRT
jgi:hypothetical protein